MKVYLTTLYRDNKSVLLFIVLMCVFRSAIADWNEVPTGSMQPTIVEGDRIWVNKLAYDVSTPFVNYSLLKLADPIRGDIIVFDSAPADKRLVKRVVGIPGDTIAMIDNVLYINQQPLSYENNVAKGHFSEVTENLLGVQHRIRVANNGSRLSSFTPLTIPADYYLAMGDNRDNSADSRVIGLIPRDEIIGRANKVVMSLNYDNYYLPRTERFLHTLL
ncbi:MAG: signal peptidase I [Alteromonadaceae bacterium]|jgi:signal peptidase I|uniref:Signal peptidase I n=1 Tax=Paraglaciecola agarilytica NO2 TaxID=1125747 RepID=A0ABQ0ICR2_9ALTE|nr:signal peptidase I [Paraglaciecola agarilytica]MBN26638.1 signal peptidase I [Alteromonadaceae bacterium]GAC07061.1 signal peptidase I [Paraglaciecola agarilytica NO2]|tara:strand:+ start:45824 stop:46477 length:654 start_codon:yes stop_codon:yes gene_type:complete